MYVAQRCKCQTQSLLKANQQKGLSSEDQGFDPSPDPYQPYFWMQDLTQVDVKLPTLGPKLAAFCKELNEGIGFKLVRGVPVERYTTEESVTAFWCIGLHVGKARPQNRRQHLLGHVKVHKTPLQQKCLLHVLPSSM